MHITGIPYYIQCVYHDPVSELASISRFFTIIITNYKQILEKLRSPFFEEKKSDEKKFVDSPAFNTYYLYMCKKVETECPSSETLYLLLRHTVRYIYAICII